MECARVTVPFRYSRRGRVLKSYADDLAKRLGVQCFLAEDRATVDDGVTIRVSDERLGPEATTCHPFEEEAVFSRGRGEALFPLGNGESGVHAIMAGLPIAEALRLPVVFYHTTWRDRSIVSDDPREHVCASARDVLVGARIAAVERGIASREAIEMAEDVVEGVIRRALADRCPLIVVARGLSTGRGSYVDQLIAKSPVPVLVMGRKAARP